MMKQIRVLLFTILLVLQIVKNIETKKSGKTILVGGGGCGAKMVLKLGGKKMGNIILVSGSNCKSNGGSQSSPQIIPYPMMYPYQG